MYYTLYEQYIYITVQTDDVGCLVMEVRDTLPTAKWLKVAEHSENSE